MVLEILKCVRCSGHYGPNVTKCVAFCDICMLPNNVVVMRVSNLVKFEPLHHKILASYFAHYSLGGATPQINRNELW